MPHTEVFDKKSNPQTPLTRLCNMCTVPYWPTLQRCHCENTKIYEFEFFLMPYQKMLEDQPSNSMNVQTLDNVLLEILNSSIATNSSLTLRYSATRLKYSNQNNLFSHLLKSCVECN